jgi:hypothetical protein
MGVTEEMIAGELLDLLGPFIEQARLSGFLEERIRARLEPFYRSSTAAGILAGAAKPA